MKVVVLGADGQLGQCFRALAPESSVIYHFYGRSGIDIGDMKSLERMGPETVDVVVNCAAYTQVDRAESEREQAHRINVRGPENLGQFAFRYHLPIIHFSTDYIFAPASEPIAESHPIRPINFYGKTKWEGEEALRRSGAHHCIIRTSWLYSEFGHNFVKTMLRLAKDRSEISVVNDQTGSPTYARDLAVAVDAMLTRSGRDFPRGTYHFANKGATTWYGFAKEILQGRDVEVHPILTSAYPTSAQRPVYSVLDVSYFEKTFDWEVPAWRDALRRCIARI